jgi:hypothetical protein
MKQDLMSRIAVLAISGFTVGMLLSAFNSHSLNIIFYYLLVTYFPILVLRVYNKISSLQDSEDIFSFFFHQYFASVFRSGS